MNKPHLDALETGFLQLSFAIKLWHYLDEHPINKELFDIDLTIEDLPRRVCLPGNEFHSYDDMKLASENNISICFGAAATTLWEALNETLQYSEKKPNPMTTQKEMSAGLCYMIRCCFAHGTAVPRWKITSKYRTVYALGEKTIDLTSLDGKPFDYTDIGGCETLWLLKAEALCLGML